MHTHSLLEYNSLRNPWDHQRKEFEVLLADVNTPFQTLTQTLDDLLRHIGSPFAPDKVAPRPHTQAA